MVVALNLMTFNNPISNSNVKSIENKIKSLIMSLVAASHGGCIKYDDLQ